MSRFIFLIRLVRILSIILCVEVVVTPIRTVRSQDFHIQISASKKQLNIQDVKLNDDLRKLLNVAKADGWYKYYIGNFPSDKEAQEYLNNMKIQGFVTTYQNTEMIQEGIPEYPNICRIVDTFKPVYDSIQAQTLDSVMAMTCDKSLQPMWTWYLSPENTGYFTDERDGNRYRWVRIGSQIWMGENVRFDTGNVLNTYPEDSVAGSYGFLYKFDDAVKACPDGWHLPADKDWMELEEGLGLNSNQLRSIGYRDSFHVGMLLKSSNSWKSEGNGTDYFGFTAYPVGMAKKDKIILMHAERAYFWSASKSGMAVWMRFMQYDSQGISRGLMSPAYYLSVRCIKENDPE